MMDDVKNGSMYQETINLLATAKAKGQLRKIADQTSLDYDWITQVSAQRIKDPGVKKIEKLHAYLKATQ